MNAKLYLAIAFSFILVSQAAFAVPMGNLVITAKPEKSPLESTEIPVIVGTVTDQASKPIADAKVSISTSYGTETLMTDSDGKFRFEYANSVLPNQYIVNIKAQKDGYGVGLGKTTFFVKGIPVYSQPEIKTVTGDKIKQDITTAKIQKNIEAAQKKQAMQAEKLKKIEENKKFLESQRALANNELQFDLQGWLTQFDPFTPRNAYASFVGTINSTLQNIFWGQFNFTEQKHNDGLQAKYEVLKSGGTKTEATKAFIQKAKSSRNEIIKVNNDLNVKYGFATNKTQSKFDSYGKLPRNR